MNRKEMDELRTKDSNEGKQQVVKKSLESRGFSPGCNNKKIPYTRVSILLWICIHFLKNDS